MSSVHVKAKMQAQFFMVFEFTLQAAEALASIDRQPP